MDFHACNCVFKTAYLYKLVDLDYKRLQKCRSFFFLTSIVLFFILFQWKVGCQKDRINLVMEVNHGKTK